MKKLKALTSLRFIAALMIVIHHEPYGIKKAFFDHFVLEQGVSFFFVLSGFILTYVYPKLNNSVDTRQFLLARFARIWPAHLFTFILYITLFGCTSIWKASANISMIHAWIPLSSYFFSFNGPSWSISTEFFFYLMFPLLIWRWEQSWLIKFIVSVILLIAIIGFCNMFELHLRGSVIDMPFASFLYINPLGRLFEFVLGMTIAQLYRKGISKISFSIHTATMLEGISLLLVVVSLYYTKTWLNMFPSWIGTAGKTWFNGSGTSIFFGLLIMAMAMEKGYFSKILVHPILVLLGEISYAVYLMHKIIFDKLAGQRFASFFTGFPAPAICKFIVSLTVLLIASYLVWHLIEKPSRKYLVGMWRPLRAAG